MNKLLSIIFLLTLFISPVYGATKFSQIASGGALTPATDQMLAVRSGTTDVLVTPPAQLTSPNSTLTFGGTATNPTVDVANLSANQLLGALTGTFPTGLNVPSCSTSSSALRWTSGTGFTCNTSIGAATVPQTGITGTFAQGDIMYYNGANWVDLAAGTNGFFLKTQGAAANPVWAAATASIPTFVTAMAAEVQINLGGL